MLRKSILVCLVTLLSSTVTARAAEDSSSEEAPFAGGGNKAPAPFAASPSAGFAAMGQWAISMRTTGDGGGFVFFHKDSPGDWHLSLHPSIDYFIINSVSLGATLGYTYSPADTGTTIFDIGGRAGFNLNINDNLGFWPSAGLSLNVNSSNHNTNTTTFLGVFAPFLYHLVPHLFVGLGPSFSLQLSGGSGKQFGVDFVIGGWL
ncbi:MAG TPA: hypothetical protein VN903_17350 [Polyangia bacterium]|jgi:hypothetical protein|nr:hypothetical protein [Polyangia bacterium]